MYENYQIISKSIRSLREKKGYTRERLAEEVDLSPEYLKKVEAGQRRVGMEAYLRILRVLGVASSSVSSEANGKDRDVFEKYQHIMKGCGKEERKFLLDTLESMKTNMRRLVDSGSTP